MSYYGRSADDLKSVVRVIPQEVAIVPLPQQLLKSQGEERDQHHNTIDRSEQAGLRHTWASLAVRNGVPLMVVAQNLGHRRAT